MRRPVLTLVLLASLTFFLGLGRQAITDGDEAYYAEAAREMVEGGDWLTPHFDYDYRWEKPVLYYWLTSSVYLVMGPTEAAARFWSALSGVGLVLLTWAIARDSGSTVDAAWIAGAITATCFGYFAEARLALPDLPLTFGITLTTWSALRVTVPWGPRDQGPPPPSTRRAIAAWALAGLGAGLGFLMKGPVALVVPAVVLLPIWWRDRASLRMPWRGVLLALAVFAIVGLPWYMAMTIVHGRAYLDSFFVGDNLQRFATSRYAGRTSSSWWFYGPILLGGLVPWTAYAVAFLAERLFGPRRGRARWRLASDEWRLLLWGVMPLLFFTASVGKQPRYILPVLPPLAILIARSLSRRVDAADVRQRGLTIATWCTAALFFTAAVLLVRARPLFITAYAAATWAGVAATLAAALAIALVALTHSWRRLPPVLALSAAVLLLTLQFGALAGARPEPVEQMWHLVRAYRVGNEPVGQYQVFVRNMVFYAGFRQQNDLDETTAPGFLRSPGRVFLVARSDDAARLQEAGVPARVIGQVDYVDTANIKLRTLLWPDPQRDIETIVLLTNR